jgi:hypothetical protein
MRTGRNYQVAGISIELVLGKRVITCGNPEISITGSEN